MLAENPDQIKEIIGKFVKTGKDGKKEIPADFSESV
jgi:hypothetical protein